MYQKGNGDWHWSIYRIKDCDCSSRNNANHLSVDKRNSGYGIEMKLRIEIILC